jgi:hypothetical protein
MLRSVSAFLWIVLMFESPALALDCLVRSEEQLNRHDCYINRDRRDVHSPSGTVTGVAPPEAVARCRDGSYSFSQHSSGTCSHHGGVAQRLR